MGKPSNFLWLDIETTGLDEQKDYILEVAAAAIRDGMDGDFGVIESYATVVSVPKLSYVWNEVHPVVQEMHEKSGLWWDVKTVGTPIRKVEADLIAFVHSNFDVDEKKGKLYVPLAGGSVHFDKKFINVRMHSLSRLLSHRVMDVSSLKAAYRTWFGPFREDDAEPAHRAMPDILNSISEAKELKQLLKGQVLGELR
jgi:oligoribonuclease